LALAVALSLFASYAVALTVVPLFCARFIKAPAHHTTPSSAHPVTPSSEHPVTPSAPHLTPSSEQQTPFQSRDSHGAVFARSPRWWSFGERFNIWFNARFESFLTFYDRLVGAT